MGRRKGCGLLRSPAGVEEKIARGVRPATKAVLRRISVRGRTLKAREVTDVEVDCGPGLVESDVGVEGGEAATVMLPRLARRDGSTTDREKASLSYQAFAWNHIELCFSI